MKLKLVTLTALATVWLVCSAGPVISTPVDNFKAIGKIKTGTVFIDISTVQVDKDPTGGPIAAMIVKVKLNKPTTNGVVSVDNATVFSCREKTATIVASTTYDAQNVLLSASETTHVLPWVKGTDGAIDLIMKKLCAGYRQLPPGAREA